MKIELLQGMQGFSRVSPQPQTSLSGFSRVNVVNGFDLNGKKRTPQTPPRVSSRVRPQNRARTLAEIRQIKAASRMQGYVLHGDYFLDFDIDPDTLQGRKERRARRQARRQERQAKRSSRQTRKADKAARREARKVERAEHKSRRREARTLRKEKRATRKDDRRAARLARQEARQAARTERQAMRAEARGKGGLSQFASAAGDIAAGLVSGEGIDPGMLMEYGGEYIERLPSGLQEMAYEYMDAEGLTLDDEGFVGGQKSAAAGESEIPWGTIALVGGGALALYMLSQNQKPKKKRR